MSEWSYVRGPHPAILRDNTLIAIAGDGAEASARALLSTTTGTTPLEDVIDVLIADGLGTAPDFFVGRLVEGSLTAFVRGTAVVTLEDDRWHRFWVSGEHARTWQEVAIDGVTRLAVGFAPSQRTDLLSVREDEREARPGPLGVTEVVFRSPQAVPPLLTVTGAAVSRQTLEFDDAFPDDLFAPIEDEPESVPASPAVSPDQPTDEIPGIGSRFDDLFGATRFLGVEAAAVRREEPEDAAAAAVAASAPPPVPAPPAAPAPAPVPAPAGAPPAGSVELSGLVCPGGHPNPPTREACAICGARLTGARIATVGRPSLGTVVLTDGRRIPITENMIIGRSPRSERTDGSRLPTLITLDGAPGDVSRNHARVFVEGWNVLVEDLGSTNGTMVISAGGAARRLRSGETALLGRGTVLDLGGVRLLLEDVP